MLLTYFANYMDKHLLKVCSLCKSNAAISLRVKSGSRDLGSISGLDSCVMSLGKIVYSRSEFSTYLRNSG